MLTISVETDLAEAIAKLEGFSDRRLRAAISTALTRTAKDVAQAVKDDLPRQLKNPTPYTLRGVRFKGATADSLAASVYFPNVGGSGQTPQGRYVGRLVDGGRRAPKRFELALQARGLMPAGWIAVPGPAAKLDSYGNLSPGLVRQLLTLQAGKSSPVKGRGKRAGTSQLFALADPKRYKRPGVYMRNGRGLSAVLLYVPAATYRPQYPFGRVALDATRRVWPWQLERALSESLARLRARGG